jgi:hypothetical protein
MVKSKHILHIIARRKKIVLKQIVWLFPVLIIASGNACSRQDPNCISLAGAWEFQIDSLDRGIIEAWHSKSLYDRITLPGSMTENLKGNKISLDMHWTGSIYDSSWYFSPEMEKFRQLDNLKYPMWLTPVRYYVGAAWYRKKVNIPESWAGRRIVLFLERVHTESRLWIDGQEVGMQNSLVAPHEYDLSTCLLPGQHTISLRVDNRIKEINVGPDSHSITDHTQGNWNGIIGRIEIRSMPPVWIDEIQIYSEPESHAARVQIKTGNRSEMPANGVITLMAESFNTEMTQRITPEEHPAQIPPGDGWFEYIIDMGTGFLPWDEFTPALYMLTVRLKTAAYHLPDEKKIQFGMRSFQAGEKGFLINGRPVFLRGNVDCAAFPLTGYPPMDVPSWEKLFTILKDNGLNHVRYHSWCPPEAAFIAADRKGMYLQPEGPSWPNHGVTLGDGLPVDSFLYEEIHRMKRYYGNCASWVMLACGNEPAGRNQVRYLGDFITYWKKKDPRRLYTGAAVGSRWPDVPEAEYIVKARPRGLPWNQQPPQTMFDHRKVIESVSVPYVSHEIGQYCAFPDFRDIDKYSGVMKAKNFELFRDILQEHDMSDRAEIFLQASGKLQLLCYKHEIEAALRTPGLGGFQMLSLNDFPGQGTALIGVLNSLYQEKGYAGPDEFSRFCGPTVLLARIPKFVFTTDESFTAELEVSHFDPLPVKNARIVWKISNDTGAILNSGVNELPLLPVGNATPAGSIVMNLSQITSPGKLNLEVRLENTSVVNDWDFWVYPSALPELHTDDLYICKVLDDNALHVLAAGGKVLILAAGRIEKGKDIVMHFMPVFWNTSWYRMRPPHVTGIVCEADHPVFRHFPTSFHTDLQWWEIQHNQQVMLLDSLPKGFVPLIQPIDTWFLSRKLGALLEARVLNGKIMVCSLDLTTNLEQRPVARQLLYSIKDYMESADFHPSYTLKPEVIAALFKPADEPDYRSYTVSGTDDLAAGSK